MSSLAAAEGYVFPFTTPKAATVYSGDTYWNYEGALRIKDIASFELLD